MAVLVEHDKRKHEILEKSLELFIEEGYEDVTFQKIADRCGITRTTLYIYFKNKREIFLWSIKQLLSELEEKINEKLQDDSLPAAECLNRLFNTILDTCEENRLLFKVLLSYLMQLEKSGTNPAERVRRRVLRLQHLMSTIIIRGQNKGELKKLSVKEINDLFYNVMEGAIFCLAVLGKDLTETRASLALMIECLKA